jgi:UDP-N-acetylmuramoyl-tripeptide--D-alanyl-D-alanine ligase
VIRSLIALYNVHRLATTLTYMLQNVEYQPVPYAKWFWRTQDFSKVMYRRKLDNTGSARVLRLVLEIGMATQVIFGFGTLWLGMQGDLMGGIFFGLALLLSYPVVWAHIIILPLIAGRELIVRPKERRMLEEAEKIFSNHPGIKVAVAGSYGKTTMKELLTTVLSKGKKVAATPANKNVAISHAHFAQNLTGDEDILIIEYGEGRPGDVLQFARLTHPTYGVITGLAPAHLEKYKTLHAAGKDIFSLANYLANEQLYVNEESEATQPFIKPQYELYSRAGVGEWKVQNIMISLQGTQFELNNGSRSLQLKSRLLGAHQVGPLSLAAILALEFGLAEQTVVEAVATTKPFEHRMQTYELVGATVIDDTYNGNIEGIRAGTELLAALAGKRKIYVTPGLVDQGVETKAVHEEMGRLISAARPNLVVLMRNSVTNYIQTGLKAGAFTGELRVEEHPLQFYQNLDQHLAAGDLVLMQNDWTDNYQ